MKTFALFAVLSICGTALAAETPAGTADSDQTATKVTYKGGKQVNFEELLIQGQLKRPEVSVVTGNQTQGTDGMLRLRENFVDRLAEDAGEEATQ